MSRQLSPTGLWNLFWFMASVALLLIPVWHFGFRMFAHSSISPEDQRSLGVLFAWGMLILAGDAVLAVIAFVLGLVGLIVWIEHRYFSNVDA